MLGITNTDQETFNTYAQIYAEMEINKEKLDKLTERLKETEIEILVVTKRMEKLGEIMSMVKSQMEVL